MRLTPEQRRAYLASGCSRCPYCASTTIEGTGDREQDGDWLTNTIVCLACGERWKDVYTITDVQGDDDTLP